MVNLKEPIAISEQNWDDNISPLVSIQCITYNHEKYIKDAIEGFLMQKTNFPVEILIHDDASTDRTAEIIREYELRYPNLFKPIYQVENQYSKKKGVITRIQNERAKGKYIAKCEGDDYWTDPLKLQKQVAFLEENPEYVLSCHNYQILDFDGKSLRKEYEHKFVNNKESIDIDEEVFLNHWITKTLSVVLINDPKIFNENSKIKNQRDLTLFYTFIKNGKGIFHNFYGGVYRKQKGGVHSSNSALQAEKETLKILEELNFIYNTKALQKKIQFVKRNIIYYNFKSSDSKSIPLREIRNLKISLKEKFILLGILIYNKLKI
ncbi:glycosyltransferase [Weeksellaceae bacterium KMM 9724]|uniref:glycosyltransferase family 2 protein n=1 Tax=Profundicola chukchiensis TaxID=2961959 RepID=UPI00243D7FEE|nr:glycosyltransferase [Profundicola chukchiensis]MDG4949884.1 glycosyltransferase [Profundicola chukchiensis]